MPNKPITLQDILRDLVYRPDLLYSMTRSVTDKVPLDVGQIRGISGPPSDPLPRAQFWYRLHTPAPVQSLLTNLLKAGELLGLNDPMSAWGGPARAMAPLVGKGKGAAEALALKQKAPLITRWDSGSIDNSRPHGVYFTLGGKSPHDDIGSTFHVGEATPKNPLILQQQTAYSERFRGWTHNSEGPTSAGIAALKALSTPEEFNRLIRASKADLIKELRAKFPGYDYTRYYDRHELREAYGAHLARQKGYDAIVYPDEQHPEFSEYVALTPDAYRIKSKGDSINEFGYYQKK